jgi:5-hydroxyisourate hydrolase-like protein (transthyretin family)
MVTDSQGNPRANVKVQIYGPDGRLLATVYTDVDGYYSYAYKATGKAATYTLKLPSYNQTKSVTVKANSLVEVNFVI